MNNQMNQDGVNLVLAIIKDAVEDLEVKEHRERAKRWLESKSTGPRTFLWYCDLINISPDWALRKIGMASRSGQDASRGHGIGLR